MNNKPFKYTLINDPVYGFITVQSSLIFDLIQHPYFQRLRRIRQMGCSALVFPGARHSRFEHALGALHLMQKALTSLQEKGIEISPDEMEAAQVAILLHDIGHGPFSHALEKTIVEHLNHEKISLKIMRRLNEEFNGRLNLAIQIFTNKHPKKFLYQLVSGPIDMDRMDYLRRDSFYSGMQEGNINIDRILAVINVRENQLVFGEKGVLSLEKFLMARRLMYWQVYLHKTSLVAELMMTQSLQRAQELLTLGDTVEGSEGLLEFLKSPKLQEFENPFALEKYLELDDTDVLYSLKRWKSHSDPALQLLATGLIHRKLFRINMQNTSYSKDILLAKRQQLSSEYPDIPVHYLMFYGEVSNEIYGVKNAIHLLKSDQSVIRFDEHPSSLMNQLPNPTQKLYYLAYPKESR
ncbi:MAG: HD domain-containing protein [Flavobacteriaceae bacterium]